VLRLGVHNSGWTPSPGHERVVDRSVWPLLREYVTAVMSRFSRDARVVAWDIYNEPGNGGMRDQSLPLLSEAFRWARRVSPQQPLTTGVWDPGQGSLCETSLAASDIATYHCYGDLSALETYATGHRDSDRPRICTEWMSRPLGSLFQTHLPFFKQNGIGCFSWGLVRGKTQTYFPWDSPPGAGEPSLWFHDIFHIDGRPYREEETAFIRHCLLGEMDARSETERSAG
ncbi:MAG: endo-1,4-beta-xylanase, partial [Anaerolineae bacterium]|nr:endo-1,4-beta-xylanase [Anaerolineae bacterium]